MTESPYNFSGPGGVAAAAGAISEALKGGLSLASKASKNREKLMAKQQKAGGAIQQVSAAAGDGGSTGGTNPRAENIEALGRVLGDLIDRSAGHDLTHMKEKNRQRRLTSNNSVRQFGKIQAKPGTRVAASMGRKGSVQATFTQAPAPTVAAPVKPAAKKTTAKPAVKPAAAKTPIPKKTAAPKAVAPKGAVK